MKTFTTHLALALAALTLAPALRAETAIAAEPAAPGVAGTLPAASRASLTDNKARPFIFADPDFYQWGGTPILGDDGLYHIFYDRWPRNHPKGMWAWLYATEIAHATSANPEGPYVFRNTALRGPGDTPAGRWDAVNTHNAAITRFPDPATGKLRYYLYFIANRGDKTMNDAWMTHVMNQRIGVAYADSPDGPWTRETDPVCVPDGPLRHYVVNPGVTRLPDGRYLMVLKGRGFRPDKPTELGPMLHGWALADKPTGPFKIQPTLLFAGSVSAEDPCVWVQDGRLFAAVKDWTGKLSGIAPGISWIYGDLRPDGSVEWKKPANPLLSPRVLKWDDGKETKVHALERPFVLLDKQGRPSHLFAACSVDNEFGRKKDPATGKQYTPAENLPFNVCIPLKPAAAAKE